jgi:hypothetical protein
LEAYGIVPAIPKSNFDAKIQGIELGANRTLHTSVAMSAANELHNTCHADLYPASWNPSSSVAFSAFPSNASLAISVDKDSIGLAHI